MPPESINVNQLRDLLEEERWEAFRKAIGKMDPADVADLVEDLPPEQREDALRVLDPETASDVLAELDGPYIDSVVGELPSRDIAVLADHMAPDDAADLIADLDEEQSAAVLAAMDPEEQREIRDLLAYAEDTAGGLMTPETLALPKSATVDEALRLAAENPLSDPVFYIYVLEEPDGPLVGYVSVQDLLAARREQPLAELLRDECVFCTTDEDQEAVAKTFRRYNLWVMPVVDENRRLVGRITVDDVMDVLHEEADEDLSHMVGAPDLEEEEDSLFGMTRLRLPWLMITLFAGLLNSLVISAMMRVTRIEALAIFVPAILAMGGNTGMQSSALCIRGITLDDTKYNRLWNVVRREVGVGICLGIICGIIMGLTVWIVLTVSGMGNLSRSPMRLALVVGVAMTSAMSFSSCYGALVPIFLHRLKVDPALASGPFITTSNDLSATLIYFLTCAVLLGTG